MKWSNNDIFFAAQNVCFWHKADIAQLSSNVRFWGLVLEQLHFNSHNQTKVVLDRGVRDYLVRAIRKPR
jgi:hypothetical protein